MKCKYFFASMNSCDGFINFFDSVFSAEELETIYIIKGGAGCGKSTVMKRIAKHFEETEREVECFLCSSDTNSLDGVMIDRKIAVIDGTSPHIKDPKYAGAVEKIINFCDKLKEIRSEIIINTAKKAKAYKRAYGFLSSYGRLKKEIRDIVLEGFDYEKMKKSIERYFKQNFLKGDGYCETVRLVSAISQSGVVRLESFEEISDKILCITNAHNCHGIFLEEFLNQAKANGIKTQISYDPVFSKSINALNFPEFRMSVVLSNGKENTYDEKYKVFNLERFINKNVLSDNRVKLKFSEKCAKSILESAVAELKAAKSYHEEIEKLYYDSVDFDVVKNISSSLIKEIDGKIYH